ncbi:MAG: ATP-binding protein [Myxococcota bacterium]|jgi:PAS domain S-box-containing protein|nr:ATP-binding protein [Myxococcota bacterium]
MCPIDRSREAQQGSRNSTAQQPPVGGDGHSIAPGQLLELMPAGLMVVDQQGLITYVNAAAAGQFGYRTEELQGRWFVDLVAPEDRLHALPALLRGECHTDSPIHLRVLRADGTLALAELEGQVFPDEQGQRHTVTLIRDVTRTTSLVEQTRARDVQGAITTFASGMARELDQLLGELQSGSLAPIDDGASSPTRVACLAAQLARGAEIAGRLHAIAGTPSREGLGQLQLNETVEQVCAELRPQTSPMILLRTALAPDLRPILGSRDGLRRIVLQLCRNACDAMPLGGHLLLRTDNVSMDEGAQYGIPDARPGQFVMLTVQDDGVGIDALTLERIFEPYFTTHGREQGSGMGLALTQAIVRAHRGFISVESQPGRGTRVRVYLPVPSAPTPEPRARTKTGLFRRRGREVILLIDDREGIRPSLQPVLALLGHRVLVTGDVETARDLLLQVGRLVEIVAVDLGDPRSEPVRVIEELRAQRTDLRFLLCREEALAPAGELADLAGIRSVPRNAPSVLLQQAIHQLLDES